MPRYSMTNFAFNIRFVDPSGRSRRVLGHGNPGNLFLDFQDLDRFGAEILPSSDDDSSVEEVAPPAAAAAETPRVKTQTKTKTNNNNCKSDVVELLNSSASSSGTSTNIDDLSAIVTPEEEQVEEEVIEKKVEFIGTRLDRSVKMTLTPARTTQLLTVSLRKLSWPLPPLLPAVAVVVLLLAVVDFSIVLSESGDRIDLFVVVVATKVLYRRRFIDASGRLLSRAPTRDPSSIPVSCLYFFQ
ncbi:unknown protein [Seminavis robusta]|uniref:Uncharacterized protein n=1 Tax=Seminavis robusta TaxID=568900 RepID=A0A9N8DW41_9STRA|nr:unknown protein [Seminavis robusta]|eukprot:Sro418_g138940.1 n/a (242) ;mRNA; f:44360-45085